MPTNPTTAAELIEFIQDNYSPETLLTAIFWAEDDVRFCNMDENGTSEKWDDFKGTRLTESQVKQVLSDLADVSHDSGGVGYPTVEAIIADVKEDYPEDTNKDCPQDTTYDPGEVVQAIAESVSESATSEQLEAISKILGLDFTHKGNGVFTISQ